MLEVATFAGGCFWCLEAVFSRVRGVAKVTSGYMGGHLNAPQYKQVCEGNTGHAEVVQIEFDPAAVAYADLLDIFFDIHNPTTLNRQGNDVGTQYRSAIFYHSSEQHATARAKMAEVSLRFSEVMVTELQEAHQFWPAEAEHSQYYDLNPNQPYCMAVVGPKVQKFMQHFAKKLN